MTAKEVFRVARSAPPGHALVYHVGVCLGERPELFSEATHAVRHLYNEGLVILAQRRKSTGGTLRFEYLAIFRKRRSRPTAGSRALRVVTIDGRQWSAPGDFDARPSGRFDVPYRVRSAWLLSEAA